MLYSYVNIFLPLQMGREFKRRPLKSMSPDLQATGESLSRITPNGRRCLDAVVKCQKFIAWLQKTIKGDKYTMIAFLQLLMIINGDTT